jgi:hypothetical protein
MAVNKSRREEAAIVVVAADIGHQNIKVKVGFSGDVKGRRVNLKSSLITQKDSVDECEDNYFHLVGGRTPWANRYWTNTGSDLDSFTSTSDKGKVENLLPLFLSAIWDEIMDGDLIYYVGSVHELSWVEEMFAAVGGNHVIEHGGEVKNITVEVLRVAIEGAGAVAAHYLLKEKRPVQGRSTVLDIGSGTSIVIAMDGLSIKENTNPYALPGGGIRQIVSNLCSNTDIKKELSLDQPVNYLKMQSAILGDRVLKSRFGECDISPYLHKQVETWFAQSTKRYNVAMDEHLRQADLLLATGGGCLLPEVASLLVRDGWVIADEPLWANVDGLYLIAQKLAQKLSQREKAA